jgi:hypothetical protein
MSFRPLNNFSLAEAGWNQTVFADNVSVKVASLCVARSSCMDEHEHLEQSAGRTQMVVYILAWGGA